MNDVFTFQYSSGEAKSVSVSFEADTWTEALEEFISFMGAAYGYSIRDKIAVDMSPYAVNSDSWTGPVFNPEEEM